MTARVVRTRALALALSAVLVIQVAAVAPSAAAQDVATPTPPPVPTAAPAQDQPSDPPTQAAATAAPDPVAPAVKPAVEIDQATGLQKGAVEIAAARTEYSQTFANPDGTRTTQLFTSPEFWRTAASEPWQPVQLGFAPSGAPDRFESSRAPVSVRVEPAAADRDFVTVASGGYTIGFGVPGAGAAAATAGRRSVVPVVDGPAADYPDILPGTDLRVIANADGAKSFFIWRSTPKDPSVAYVVDAPGLTLTSQADGSISLLDPEGVLVARIPRPYAVDSTPSDQVGSGRYTDAVSLELGKDGRTVTVRVDPSWLESAVYPVYVDPSTGWVANTGVSAYGDAHTSSGFPSANYSDYQRPDSPYYHELWNGITPAPGNTGESYDFLRWDLTAIANATLDSASVRLRPYHQYYNAPTVENTALRQVTGSWTEGGITWNNQPDAGNGHAPINTVGAGACVEGAWCTWNVKAIVQNWVNNASINYGFQIDTSGHGYTYWKRFIASEQGGQYVPALSIDYRPLTATPATPALSHALAWSLDAGGRAQTSYQARVVSSGTCGTATSWVWNSGVVASSAGSVVPAGLADLGSYTWCARASDGGGWSAWVGGAFTYDAQQRGEEAYYTRVPFDLGGGWGLDVGVHNGEARLARELFAIPSYGPPQEMSLAYSSLDTAAPGPLGYGWSSSLTQTLTANTSAGTALWTRADGGRVLFTGSDAAGWTASLGHFELLAVGTGADAGRRIVTLRDQTRLVFEGSGAGRLLRVDSRFGKSLAIDWSTGRVTDASGRWTTIAMSGGLITSVADSAGRTWAFEYAASELVLVTEPDPDGSGPLTAPATALGYDTAHRLTTITRHRRTATVPDEASWTDATIVWTVAYTDGRATSVADPVAHASYGDVASTFDYVTGTTTLSLLKAHSPVARNTSVYAFDASGRVTTLTLPSGGKTKFAWNSPSSTLASIDVPVDAAWSRTSYTYTAAGSVATEDTGVTVLADLTTTGTPTTTRYAYNASNDVTEAHVADGTGDEAVTFYAYDTQGTGGTPGHLVSVTRNGTETTQYAYDANDQLVAERDPAGVVTRHWFTGGSETRTVANCTGGATWQTCDASGTHDAATNVTTTTVYTFTGIAGKLGFPDSTTTVLTGRTITYTYDDLGRVRAETDPAGTTDRKWDQLGNEVQTTLPGGLVTTRTLDLLNQVTTELAPLRTTTIEYDATGAVTKTTVAGDAVSRTYDGAGNLLSETVDPGASPHLNLVTEYAYDTSARGTATRDPRGTITRTIYDADGRVSDMYTNCTTSGTTVPADWAHCTGLGTPDRTNGTYNLHTSYTYDHRGNKLTETAPNGRMTTWTYDDLDRVTKVVDNDVASPTLPTEDVTTEYAFDTAGNKTAVKSPTAAGGASGYQVTRSFFDAMGRATRTITNCTDSGTTPPAAWQTCSGGGIHDAATNIEAAFTYDADGRTLSVTSPDPSAPTGASTATITTQYAYDAAGRTCRVVENATGATNLQGLPSPCGDPTQGAGTASANTSTLYAYDTAGNLASMTDADGHTTSYNYDTAGHPTGRTDPDGGQLSWRYDDAGRRTSQRNRTDPVPTYSVIWTYDAAGRMLTRTADGTVTSYTYDANGNRTCAGTGANCLTATDRVTASYDRLNRVLTVDDNADGTVDTTYTYSLTSPTWTDPTGSYAASLDKFDRATSMTDPVSAHAWSTSYGATGQGTGAVQGNGNTVTSTFDAIGRELTRTTKTGSTTRAAYTWSHNRAGVALSEASSITGDPSNGTVGYTFDPLGRLASASLGTSVAYTWDAATNRTGAGSSTTAFDSANRPVSGTSPTASYSSDADGRLTARPGQALAWDHLARLIAVTTAAGTTTYTYDPLDRLRTVAAPNGSRVRFRYTGLTTSAAQWIDDLAGTVTRSIANGWTGEHLADWDPAIGASSLRNYGTNAHHDVTWVADTTGAVTASLRYDPWGAPRSNPASGYTPFRFQGSWTDTGTDLSWVVTRWYAPALGAFISEDSLLGEPRDPDSRHLYAYGEGDPVNYWDPDGRFLDTILDIAFMAADLWEIVNNPTDPISWAALAADAVGALIPFVTGGGLAIRGFRVALRNGTSVQRTGSTIVRAVQKDVLGRVIDVGAKVQRPNLWRGTGITGAARQWCCGGRPGFDAGHIIAQVLGGPGGRFSDNVVPIASWLNRGPMAQVENRVRKIVLSGSPVTVRVRLIYPPGSSSIAPKWIHYTYKAENGISGDFMWLNRP